MKHITEFILEKFKIKKDIQIYDKDKLQKYLESIIYHFSLTQDDKQTNKFIENWIIDNQVQDLEFCCDEETFNDLKNHDLIDKKNFKDYNTSSYKNEECQDELNKCYEHLNLSKSCTLAVSEHMIACIGFLGTIYCWKK